MSDRLIATLSFFLLPRSWPDYVGKLIVLCMLATVMSMFSEYVLFGVVTYPFHKFFAITSMVASPLFTLVMILARRLNALQSELAVLASTDLLTGLANRRAFFDAVRQIDGGQLLLLDIDHFKMINDTYGHGVGDEVLKSVAAYLKGHVRETDTVARIGGEEFAVFLPATTPGVARQIGDRIVAGLTYETERRDVLKVTLSAGLAEARGAGSMSDLIRRADLALYKAKHDGRARVAKWVEGLSSKPGVIPA